MGATLQIGFVIIIVATLAALITGKSEPILWALILFLSMVTVSYVLIGLSKKL
jgi:energy-converting hydrogenase Eha subunit E